MADKEVEPDAEDWEGLDELMEHEYPSDEDLDKMWEEEERWRKEMDAKDIEFELRKASRYKEDI
jgi:hypothetical protein